MRTGPRIAALTLLSAVTVGAAAAQPPSAVVPNLVGTKRTQAETPLPPRKLRHKPPRPHPRYELAATKVDTGGRALTVGLAPGEWADSCRPLDHVDVAPRARYLLLTPYVNVTDEAGPCASRARSVAL